MSGYVRLRPGVDLWYVMLTGTKKRRASFFSPSGQSGQENSYPGRWRRRIKYPSKNYPSCPESMKIKGGLM